MSAGTSQTCKHETGHLVPLSGEHRLSRTRTSTAPPVPFTPLFRQTCDVFSLYCCSVVLLSLPAPLWRSQATGSPRPFTGNVLISPESKASCASTPGTNPHVSPQVKTPLTATQTQPGLVGGYSVELVCFSSAFLQNSVFRDPN